MGSLAKGLLQNSGGIFCAEILVQKFCGKFADSSRTISGISLQQPESSKVVRIRFIFCEMFTVISLQEWVGGWGIFTVIHVIQFPDPSLFWLCLSFEDLERKFPKGLGHDEELLYGGVLESE